MKQFNIVHNVGKSKYVVNYHDGVKTHKDGSLFFDIAIFKNIGQLGAFLDKLREQGYRQQLPSYR